MSTYVLVHGAWHGGWCWEKLAPLLAAEGHRVIAPDLPGHGEDKTPIEQITLQSYVDKVGSVVSMQKEPVILLGHSLGGITITQTAEYYSSKIAKLIYLTAWLLPNGEKRAGYAADITSSLIAPNMIMADDNSYATIKPEGIRPAFYHDCSDEDVERATARLCREPMAGIVTPVQYSKENFGSIPRYYIECTDDKTIPIELQRRLYTTTPVEKVISMDCSHSPFFSCAEELSSHILSL